MSNKCTHKDENGIVCGYANEDGVSYCVKCGNLLQGMSPKTVVNKDDYEETIKAVEELKKSNESLERDNQQLNNRVNTLSDTEKKHIEQINRLQKELEEKKWINIFNQWLNNNWKWCIGMLLSVIVALALMNVWRGDDTLKVPLSETTPSLESNAWKISKMDGINVNESAEVYSVDGSNSHYGMRHITENGREISVTFNVDWQLETVSSPELGEGKIERDDKLNELKLIFEKWTLKRNY